MHATSRRAVLAGLLGTTVQLASGCNVSSAVSDAASSDTAPSTSLKVAARRRGLEVYAAFSVMKSYFPWYSQSGDFSRAIAAINANFHGITNQMGEYEWRFEHDWDPNSRLGDTLLGIAQRNGLKFRMNEIYSWEFLPQLSIRTVADAEREIERRIRRLLQGRRSSFSIVGGVTEAIDNKGQFRRDGIIDRFGEEIIDFIYHVAHEVAPSVHLIYEDTGFNSRRAQSSRAGAAARLRLLERLKSRGVPVSGFGDTAQVIIDEWNRDRWFYSELEDLGLDLHLTEFQTRFLYENERTLDVSPERWAQKSSETYAEYLEFFTSFRRAKTVTFWTPFDSWNSLRAGGGTFSHARQPNARVGLFDDNYLPNGNYRAIISALS